MSENSSGRGKYERSAKTKERYSKAAKERWSRPEFRAKTQLSNRSPDMGWEEWQRVVPNAACKISGCERVAKTIGLCKGHNLRLSKYGDVQADKPFRGSENRRINKGGYVMIRVPQGTPGATGPKKTHMLEHRYIVQEAVGRPLRRNETVHHRDGNRQNNSPENLELRSGPHGVGATHAHCRTCSCFDDVPEVFKP